MDPLPRTPYRLLAWESPATNGGPMTTTLREDGYEIVVALGMQDLLHRLAHDMFDMILVDSSDAAGELNETLTRIRDLIHPEKFIPILIGVTEPDSELMSDVFHHGATDIIILPTLPEIILHRVEWLLESKESHDSLMKTRDMLMHGQTSLLEALAHLRPHSMPDMDGYHFAVRHESSAIRMGDFFDVTVLPSGKVALLMATAIGRHLGVVTNVAMAMALFRKSLMAGKSPGEALSESNEVFVSLMGPGLYITALLAILRPSNGVMDVAAAGHIGPVLHSLTETRVKRPRVESGPPLGVDPKARYKSVELALENKSRALFCTPGIWQQKDPNGDILGIERFDNLVRMTRSFQPGDALNYLLSQVRFFADGEPRHDDFSLLLVQRD